MNYCTFLGNFIRFVIAKQEKTKSFHVVRRPVRGHSQRTSEARVGGGLQNPDKPGHRKGGFIQQLGRPSLEKKQEQKHICICGTKRY